MSDVIGSDGDPHDEIERLEAQIEELAARIENCRKFILAGRIAAAVGGVLLVGAAARRDPVRSAADDARHGRAAWRHRRMGLERFDRERSGGDEMAKAETDRRGARLD